MTGWTGRSHTLFQKLLDHMTMHDHTYTVIQKRRFGMIQARNLLCKFARNFKKTWGSIKPPSKKGPCQLQTTAFGCFWLTKSQLLPSDIAFIGKLWMATLKAVSPHEDSNSTTYLSQQYHRIIPYPSAISCRLPLESMSIRTRKNTELRKTHLHLPASRNS